MIKLYQFARGHGLPNYSPFCVKLECFLRMAGLPYETAKLRDPRKGPKGKGPFIEDQGKRLGDSTLVIEYLKRSYNVNPDKWLSVEQLALTQAFQGMLEDHLYWCLLYSRWVDETNYGPLKNIFFKGMPSLLLHVIPPMVRKDVRNALWKQGLGRHSRQEIYDFGISDIEAVSDYLHDKEYIFGDIPCTLDAVI